MNDHHLLIIMTCNFCKTVHHSFSNNWDGILFRHPPCGVTYRNMESFDHFTVSILYIIFLSPACLYIPVLHKLLLFSAFIDFMEYLSLWHFSFTHSKINSDFYLHSGIHHLYMLYHCHSDQLEIGQINNCPITHPNNQGIDKLLTYGINKH